MSEVRNLKLNSLLVTDSSSGKLISTPNEFQDDSIKIDLNQTTIEKKINYFLSQPGELVVSVRSLENDFIFDVNSEGELIAIYPSNFNLYLSPEGELMFDDNPNLDNLGLPYNLPAIVQ